MLKSNFRRVSSCSPADCTLEKRPAYKYDKRTGIIIEIAFHIIETSARRETRSTLEPSMRSEDS